jgi:hypothetical protein
MTGKIRFTPKLTAVATSASEVIRITARLACTGTSGITSGRLKAKVLAPTNGCDDLVTLDEHFASLAAASVVIRWRGAARYNPSLISFFAGNWGPIVGPFNPPVTPATLMQMSFPDFSDEFTVSGSFAGTPHRVTMVMTPGLTVGGYDAACTDRGLRRLTFGPPLNNRFDIAL